MIDLHSGLYEASYIRLLRSYFSSIIPGMKFHELFNETELNEMAGILNRDEERKNTHRDQWGNWDFPFTKNDFNVPYLDNFVLKRLEEKSGIKKSIWPEGKKFAFWLTHDLDVVSSEDPHSLGRKQWQMINSSKSGSAKMVHALHYFYSQLRKLKTHSKDMLWCYERWVDAEKSHGFHSTYFVFSRPEAAADLHFYDCDYTWQDKMKFRGRLMNVGDYINQLAEEGMEIGCHGSYLSWNNAQLLMNQKSKIENLIGKKVLAARQHFLHFDINHTPDALKNAGFLLDSSLGFNRSVGYRAGTSYPYELVPGLIEVPQIIMDGSLFNSNSLELNEAMAIEKVQRMIDLTEETGGCLTINFHPNYLLIPDWWNVYVYILKELSRRNAACVNAATIYAKTQIVTNDSGNRE